MEAGDEHARALAEEAYVFGYPMVYNLAEMIGLTTAPKVQVGAPVNLFAHAPQLATPQDHFVSINNDTLYSIAVCDITREPLALHVPDTHGRYYVMQFVDAWTNNFAYVGRRATGTVGDRTPGLRYNADGSLDIVIQREPPDGESANWLPAPEGDFRPLLRMYQPREEVWRWEYILPPIRRVG